MGKKKKKKSYYMDNGYSNEWSVYIFFLFLPSGENNEDLEK